MSNLHAFTDSSFKKDVLESDKPVLVDFWAPWCGPCRMVGPILEELSKEFAGKIKIGKVNVDENSKVAGQYGVMSIPTLLFFKGGKVSEQLVGALPKQELKKKIEEHIG